MDMVYNHQLYQEDLAYVAGYTNGSFDWEQLENKTVLVTGATGLIGSFLIDSLLYRNMRYGSNITIYAISRNQDAAQKRFAAHWDNPLFHYFSHDIAKPLTLNNTADFIIHGAGNSYLTSYMADPVGTMKANLWGLANLFDYSVLQHIARILYISSGEIYGEGIGEDFVESYSGYVDPLNQRSCYSSSKRAAETLGVAYSTQYGIDVVIARPCHIYGPSITENDNRAFAQFIRNVAAKKNIVLKSKGEQYRSYCYVADCVTALLTILLYGQNATAYNIANKDSKVSIVDLAGIIASAGNKSVVFDMPKADTGYSVIKKAVLNADRLESLGWKAKYSLQDGLARTLEILRSK
ncbi:hypothetical protein FACS189461_1720 [Spirochaetia bacterium]|nr:hypothetical protein FACS189461_1720 [Spirochaetia bacterium]